MLMLLTVILSPRSALAAQWPDSLTIDSETRQILGVGQDEEVMRVYVGYYMRGVADGYSLDQLLEKDTEFTVYAWHEGEDFAVKMAQDSAADSSSWDYGDSFRYYASLDHKKILDTLGKNVTIEKMYYLNGKATAREAGWWQMLWGDMMVYYVTNAGDYVLYRGYVGEEYFLSVEDFRPFVQEMVEHRSDIDGGGDAYVPDGLAAYKLEFPEQNIFRDILLWSIPVVVILTAGGLWFFLRRRKKKEA